MTAHRPDRCSSQLALRMESFEAPLKWLVLCSELSWERVKATHLHRYTQSTLVHRLSLCIAAIFNVGLCGAG